MPVNPETKEPRPVWHSTLMGPESRPDRAQRGAALAGPASSPPAARGRALALVPPADCCPFLCLCLSCFYFSIIWGAGVDMGKTNLCGQFTLLNQSYMYLFAGTIILNIGGKCSCSHCPQRTLFHADSQPWPACVLPAFCWLCKTCWQLCTADRSGPGRAAQAWGLSSTAQGTPGRLRHIRPQQRLPACASFCSTR